MDRLRVVLVPVWLALRRMRKRPFAVAVIAVALAAAAALIGWSSIAAALSHEKSVRLQMAELPSDERAVQVVYHLFPGETDKREVAVNAFFDRFAPVSEKPRRVSLWHSVGEANVRLVAAGEPAANVALFTGRLPTGCRAGVCEALRLAGDYRVGQRVRLGPKAAVRIVGTGSLRPEALPADSDALPATPELTERALLIHELEEPLASHARETGASVVTTAVLDAEAVHASELRALSTKLRRDLVRLERSAPSLEAGPAIESTAPLALLDELADRGEVARERLLLVAGQGAALVVAFAAFTASARRRETLLLDEQLTTLGASRVQVALARLVEAAAPSLVGALLALAGVWGALQAIEQRRDLPADFAAAALSAETVVAIATVTAAAIALLFAALAPRRRSRFGVGALELAAVIAFALVAWQASVSGALDPERIEAGERAGPVLLLLPALAFFATSVLLLRLLPLSLKLAERLSRRAPFGLRLAFLTAARSPAQGAAATTFLAVALGAALFGLNYRATLERQSQDEARFAAGAHWRVSERARGEEPAASVKSDTEITGSQDARPLTIAEEERVSGDLDVTPLTRFAAATDERPTPVLRLDARVQEAGAAGEELELEVLALPAGRLPDVLGWRDTFSELAPAEIAERLRPEPVVLAGPRISTDARALRFWARSDTRLDRFVVLHFLRPEEQRFLHLRVGRAVLTSDWRELRLPLPASLQGAEIVGVEFPPVSIPLSAPPDWGSLQFGRFEERRGGRWSRLRRADAWTASAAGGSVDVFQAAGPVRRPIQFDLKGTVEPLVHPDTSLPERLPVLASSRVAHAAVDGVLTLNIRGKEVPVRVAAATRLFPTVIEDPLAFVVLDYETLFAALNVDQPGAAVPSEAWFFRPQPASFGERLGERPFRVETALAVEPLTARLLHDPLAAGARQVLGLTAVAAAVLGLFGLILAARSTLASERLLLAEYEALGVRPATLARSTHVRLLTLSLLGVAAGFVGSLLAVRLIATLVAVTGTASRPLPPIEPVVAWRADLVVVLALGVATSAAAALLAGRALREPAARRLRA